MSDSVNDSANDSANVWGDLSPDQLDDLCIFGPREDDQPVP